MLGRSFVHYHCDTCGGVLEGALGEAPEDVRTFRCPQCFGAFPTPRTLVLARVANVDRRRRRRMAAPVSFAHPERLR